MAEQSEEQVKQISSSHPIFHTDPADWMQYIYKEVCITTDNGKTHTGQVYTIDPVSQTVVLVTLDDMSVVQVKAVMRHCIQNTVILGDNVKKYRDVLDNLFKLKDNVVLSPEELTLLQERLKSSLEEQDSGDSFRG